MKEDIKLEEGELICDNCYGDAFKNDGSSVTFCMKCWGTGKLDWVDLCVGKKMPHSIFALPKIRQVYPKLLANELISIQPNSEK